MTKDDDEIEARWTCELEALSPFERDELSQGTRDAQAKFLAAMESINGAPGRAQQLAAEVAAKVGPIKPLLNKLDAFRRSPDADQRRAAEDLKEMDPIAGVALAQIRVWGNPKHQRGPKKGHGEIWLARVAWLQELEATLPNQLGATDIEKNAAKSPGNGSYDTKVRELKKVLSVRGEWAN